MSNSWSFAFVQFCGIQTFQSNARQTRGGRWSSGARPCEYSPFLLVALSSFRRSQNLSHTCGLRHRRVHACAYRSSTLRAQAPPRPRLQRQRSVFRTSHAHDVGTGTSPSPRAEFSLRLRWLSSPSRRHRRPRTTPLPRPHRCEQHTRGTACADDTVMPSPLWTTLTSTPPSPIPRPSSTRRKAHPRRSRCGQGLALSLLSLPLTRNKLRRKRCTRKHPPIQQRKRIESDALMLDYPASAGLQRAVSGRVPRAAVRLNTNGYEGVPAILPFKRAAQNAKVLSSADGI
ncbi:hypothetical protein B0H19DRAFT_1140444 [Mycena capillaripes]|nr:hypothetical protein B0H19DRAFT_1140444 [Mycena capillaripes]